jgi:hypothetical protein
MFTMALSSKYQVRFSCFYVFVNLLCVLVDQRPQGKKHEKLNGQQNRTSIMARCGFSIEGDRMANQEARGGDKFTLTKNREEIQLIARKKNSITSLFLYIMPYSSPFFTIFG